jgi:hypothetical protein
MRAGLPLQAYKLFEQNGLHVARFVLLLIYNFFHFKIEEDIDLCLI